MNTQVRYLGLDLPHPFISGAGPLGDTLDGARQVEDGGAAALVLRSLFEEQIEAEAMATYFSMESHSNMFGEASSFIVDPDEFRIGPEMYLEHLALLSRSLDIPVIASLNGTSLGGWLGYGKSMQEAGAAAIELNLFDIPMNESVTSEEIEKETAEIVVELRAELSIPIAVKISPFYTSLPHFAKRLEEAGADGLVIFNRFFESDIDLEQLRLTSEMRLSNPRELLLRLRWLSILSGLLDRVTLSVSGGVHGPIDAVKAIMSGASSVQMVAALIHHGPDYIGVMREQLVQWMEQNEYESVEQMRGSMDILRSPNPEELARVNYMRMLQTWTSRSS